MRIFLALLFLFASSAFATVTPIPNASDQRITAGSPFFYPIGVRVTDDAGRPVPEVEVLFVSTTLRGGGLEGASPMGQLRTRADVNGVAMMPEGVYALGPGTYELYAITDDFGTAVIRLIAEPRALTSMLSVVSGDEQVTIAGTPLPQRHVVRLQQLDGTPIPHTVVAFFTDPAEPTGSFGGASSAYVATDADGYAVAPEFTTTLEAGRGLVVAGRLEVEGNPGPRARMIFTSVAPATGPTNYQDMWWGGPSENGWGMSLVQHGEKIFAVLFVYDLAGNPTWYVMPNPTWFQGYGRILLGEVYQPKGTPWSAYDASRLEVGPSMGYARVNFLSGNTAKLFFSGAHFDAIEYETAKGKFLTRQDFTSDPSSPLRGVGDMWWGGVSQNGWGIAALEQPGELFAVWFTYDDAGKPTWFVMPGGSWSGASEFAGALYRTSGSTWREQPYDPSQLQVVPVGQYRFRFGGETATFEFSIEGRSGTLSLSRQPF